MAPEKISDDELNHIIEKKSYWIYKSLSELEELNSTSVNREIKNGEGFLYLGKSYKLRIKKNLNQPLSLRQGCFHLDTFYQDNSKDYFIDFYKNKGKKHIQQRVNYFKGKLGIEPNPIRVIDLQNRWGSCSEKYVNFHWKIMMAPMQIIDYVIVHELAHQIETKHNDSFWEIVESVIPDYRTRKYWLRINGANLNI